MASFNKKARLRDNIEAIATMYDVEWGAVKAVAEVDTDAEEVAAAAEVRNKLSRYSGFGGIKAVLNPAAILSRRASCPTAFRSTTCFRTSGG